jgi:hypothetical protein
MTTLHDLWAAVDLAMRTGVDPQASVEFFVTRNPNAVDKSGSFSAKLSHGPEQTRADGFYDRGSAKATFYLEEE